MIIYEVNLAIDKEIAEAYGAWLEDHIQQILALDGFAGAEWFEVEEVVEEKLHWTIQYRLTDIESLQHYLAMHATAMREDGLRRFPGKFSATRRIMAHHQSFR